MNWKIYYLNYNGEIVTQNYTGDLSTVLYIPLNNAMGGFDQCVLKIEKVVF